MAMPCAQRADEADGAVGVIPSPVETGGAAGYEPNFTGGGTRHVDAGSGELAVRGSNSIKVERAREGEDKG